MQPFPRTVLVILPTTSGCTAARVWCHVPSQRNAPEHRPAANDHRFAIPYFPRMTASEIIHEIDCLPPAELAEVVRHTKLLDTRRPLSGAELTELAQRMVDATDPAEADRLQTALVKGFYGAE